MASLIIHGITEIVDLTLSIFLISYHNISTITIISVLTITMISNNATYYTQMMVLMTIQNILDFI